MTDDSKPDSGATPEATQHMPAWQGAREQKLVESGDGEDAPAPSTGAVPPTPRSTVDDGSAETLKEPPPAGSTSSSALSSSGLSSSDATLATPAPLPTPAPSSAATPADATVVGAEPQAKKPSTAKWTGENLTGKKLGGDFLLEKMVGRGGMGEVYRAKQVSLDRTVAVKCLPRTLANQPGFIDRFQREAKSAANIVHPNVIQIYAFGVEEGVPYFAMEYVEGEDLQQRLRRLGKLEVDEAVGKTLSVASALQAAHERQVIHRDVKPSNVMLDRNDNVRVMDFGLAKATQGGTELTQSGMIMGTPNYLSPEQGRGDTLDGRSDLYSLGVMFYELLVGRVPFTADTPAGLIFKHIYENPPKPRDKNADIPPFVEEIVLKLLAKDPEERYKDAKALVADLREFLDNRDHYYAGGARREGAGQAPARRSVSQVPVANPTTATPAANDPNRTVGVVAKSPTDSGVRAARNAVTEEVARDRVPPPPPALPPPPPRSSPVVPILVLLLAGGGVFAAWKTGKLDAFLNPPTNGGGGGTPTPPANAKIVWLKPTKEQVGFRGLKKCVIRKLTGENPVTLTVGERIDMAEGPYELIAERDGYENINQKVRLVEDESAAGQEETRGRARILDLNTQAPFLLENAYKAKADLVDSYAKGAAALDASDLPTASAALENAAHFDPDYRPSAEKPTAGDLLAEAKRRLGQASAGQTEAQQLSDKKAWRELKKVADPHKADPAWKVYVDLAEKGIADGERLVGSVKDLIAQGELAKARTELQTLASSDPGNDKRDALATELETAQKAHGDAFTAADTATNPDEVAAAIKLFDAYLALAPRDAAAASRREQLAKRPTRDLAAEIDAAIKAKDWAKANAILEDPKADAKVKALAGRVREEQGKDSASARVASLDVRSSELFEQKPGAIEEFLDSKSPDVQKEIQAFKELEAAGAKIVASKHAVKQVTVDPNASPLTAEVVTQWSLDVEIEGEKQHLELVQKLAMKVVTEADGKTKHWKITRASATRAP